MTEPMSPEQAGAGRPRFDPARSAAIRSMLIETVEAEGRAGAAAAAGSAAPSRHRRRRTAVIVALAVLAGGIVSGTAAIALTGGSLFGPPEPVVTTVAPTPTPTPTPTRTPPPTPTPTAPPNPPAPVVRVPATCDQLLPRSAAEAIVDVTLVGLPSEAASNPLGYTGERVGTLSCGWTVEGTQLYQPAGFTAGLTIVPDVSDDAYAQQVQKEGLFVGNPVPEIGPDVYSSCTPSSTSTPNVCAFIDHIDGYGVELFSAVGRTMTESEIDATRVQFQAIREQVASLAPPAPLWQPTGRTLRGADSCSGLIDPGVLAGLLGVPTVNEFKSEEGEYAISPFFSGEQVGAYQCSWITDGPSAAAAVLPGGASYFAEAASADPDAGWVPTTDYPGEAYLSADGTKVTVLVEGGWVRVEAPAEVLHAVADVVLTNVGATP